MPASGRGRRSSPATTPSSASTVPLYQSHGVASKSFIELAGPAAEGVRLPAAALLVAAQLPDDDPQKPVRHRLQGGLRDRHGAADLDLRRPRL